MLMSSLAIVGAYLLGALPFGLIFSRLLTDVDIREHGSGNIGATNALRVAGPLVGVLTLLADIAKGAVPMFFVLSYEEAEPLLIALVAVAVFLGHMFPIYLNFKGGKGVATMLGILLIWQTAVALCAMGLWALVMLVSRYVSMASIAAAAVLPVFSWYFGTTMLVVWVHAFFGMVIILRHRENIERLLAGVENKVGKKT